MANEKDPFATLKESLAPLKMKISKQNAFLGVSAGVATYFFSLFLTWSQARTGISTSDAGMRSGWEEVAFIALIPLAYLSLSVWKDKLVSIKKAIVLVSISFGLLIFINVVERSEWGSQPSIEASIFGEKWQSHGSDLGVGFWIGLLALLATSICCLAWTMHKLDDD